MSRFIYRRGFYAATDQLLSWVNSLDTSGMDAAKVRSVFYAKLMEMRPAPRGDGDAVREALETARLVMRNRGYVHTADQIAAVLAALSPVSVEGEQGGGSQGGGA